MRPARDRGTAARAGTIHPYWVSGCSAVIPSSAMSRGWRRTASSAARKARWSTASSATWWSDGMITTSPSGSRSSTCISGRRIPAAVPRDSGWTITFSPGSSRSSSPQKSRCASVTITRMRAGSEMSRARRRVSARRLGPPASEQNCLGTVTPERVVVSSRRRRPSPPASTIVQGPRIDASPPSRIPVVGRALLMPREAPPTRAQ